MAQIDQQTFFILIVFFTICGFVSICAFAYLTYRFQKQDEKVYVDDLVQRGDELLHVEDQQYHGNIFKETAPAHPPLTTKPELPSGASVAEMRDALYPLQSIPPQFAQAHDHNFTHHPNFMPTHSNQTSLPPSRRGSKEYRHSSILETVEDMLFHDQLAEQAKIDEWRQVQQQQQQHTARRSRSNSNEDNNNTLLPLQHTLHSNSNSIKSNASRRNSLNNNNNNINNLHHYPAPAVSPEILQEQHLMHKPPPHYQPLPQPLQYHTPLSSRKDNTTTRNSVQDTTVNVSPPHSAAYVSPHVSRHSRPTSPQLLTHPPGGATHHHSSATYIPPLIKTHDTTPRATPRTHVADSIISADNDTASIVKKQHLRHQHLTQNTHKIADVDSNTPANLESIKPNHRHLRRHSLDSSLHLLDNVNVNHSNKNSAKHSVKQGQEETTSTLASDHARHRTMDPLLQEYLLEKEQQAKDTKQQRLLRDTPDNTVMREYFQARKAMEQQDTATADHHDTAEDVKRPKKEPTKLAKRRRLSF